jgi:hypothetical protein
LLNIIFIYVVRFSFHFIYMLGMGRVHFMEFHFQVFGRVSLYIFKWSNFFKLFIEVKGFSYCIIPTNISETNYNIIIIIFRKKQPSASIYI